MAETESTTKMERVTEETTAKRRQDEQDEAVIVSNFVSFFQPLVHSIDKHVEALRVSQCDLTNQIKFLLIKISKIYEDEKKKLDLDEYTKRLVVAKKRLHSVQATIMSVQERVNRLYANIQKDPVLNQSRASQ